MDPLIKYIFTKRAWRPRKSMMIWSKHFVMILPTAILGWRCGFCFKRGQVEPWCTGGRDSSYGIKWMIDKRMTVKHIAETLDISVGSVYTALTEIFGMSKLSKWWHQTKNWTGLKCQEHLVRFRPDPAYFFKGIVTQDETWVHNFDPE